MGPFLDRLAHLLLEHHRDEMDRIAVVLPGRRAGLHLRKYLAQANGKALWSPEVLDMGAFAQRATGLKQGGSLELLFLLYDAHRSLNGDRTEPFAEFLEWATVAVRDMSEVDAHLLDHNALYRDLREYHELEEWSFRLGELSPGQQRLNNQWRSTGELHRLFAERMMERGIGTSGHVARQCAEMASAGTLATPWKAIWFAGLNALDPASTAVIKALQKSGIGKVAWDADTHYLKDPRQEAGRYLRRSITELGVGELAPQSGIMERERKIHTVAAPHALAQTTYVAQRLAELTLEERSRTAVVLADEALLLPLLEQLPTDIGPLNVTMGMPLKALPVNGLTDAFLDLLATGNDGVHTLTTLEALLGHPFLHEGSITTRLILGLRELQQVRIDQADLLRIAKDSGSVHVEDMTRCTAPLSANTDDLAVRFNTLFAWAKNSAPRDRSVQEQLFQMARLQQRLDRTLAQVDIGTLDVRTYATIRDRLLREERIAFLGEPLRGLQVMGLLETRALDHERLIMLSMNEGVLPRATAQQSWIPFDVRKHYTLPMPSDGEAISAYHFQRSMHMASEVEWVHTNGSDDDAGGPSRFIAQWEHEVIGHSRSVATSQVVASNVDLRAGRSVVVEKDSAVLGRLATLCERGLSPSALGTWLRCPLDFYYRYVLGIRETEIADGTLGSDVLGDAVHHVLQELLTPFVGKSLGPGDVKEMVAQVPDLLTDRLAQRFPPKTLEHGHFRLRREMAGRALETYLEAEGDRCGRSTTSIVAIEQEVKATLSNGVLLKGRCDRIDVRDGLTMVLDVKTGSVRPEDLRLMDLSLASIGPGQRYALQLLTYAWAYLVQHPTVERVGCGVIPLQRAAQADGEFLKVGQSTVLQRDQIADIDALLAQLVNELLDPARPFQHDPDSTYCTCCVG